MKLTLAWWIFDSHVRDHARYTTGMRRVKVEPRPGALSRLISPSSIWARRRLIARPSPAPPAARVGEESALELERPGRIVYTQQFCDEHEHVTRHPMSPTWPETMLTTVRLTAEGPDQTRVTVKWEPHGASTREELDTFVTARGGMTQGWTGSFDKLEAYLAR